MRIKMMKQDLTVCKVTEIPAGMLDSAELCFVGKTDEELSLVCETERVPSNTIEREDGWKAFRIEGVLDFSLTGILAKLSGVLADEGIGIFAVSTYNTDYVLVKSGDLENALHALARAGYDVED